MANKGPDIGLRKAKKRLCQMKREELFAFLADVLPISLQSAQGYWKTSDHLTKMDMRREAEVLEGFSKEKAAKILILIDAVRCPERLLPSKLGTIIGWFYDHMARLIYAQAVTWKPVYPAELHESINRYRKTHGLEAFAGESIIPTGPSYLRESVLYADVEVNPDGDLVWNDPTRLFYASTSAKLVLDVVEVNRPGFAGGSNC